MARSPSSDETPAPDGPASSTAGGVREKLLSEQREVILFRQIKAGASAIDRLTRCIAGSLNQHVVDCGQSQLPVATVQEAIENCIRRAIAQQALRPTGRFEFSESLRRAIRVQLQQCLHDKNYESELSATAWIEQVCNEKAIEAAIGDELWELESAWEALAQRERAIQEVIESHLILAKSIARTNQRKPHEFEDLVHEAVLILRRIVDRFDPSVGVRFSSYAKQVLLRELRRQLDAATRLTRHSSDQARAVNRAERKLIQERSGPVTTDEVYDLLGHSAETRREIENVRRLLLAERSQSDIAAQRSAIPTCLSDELPEEGDDFRKQVLLPAFGSLTRLEKRVVVGIAICGQSIRDLAKRYRKNHATISRLYKAALESLAKRIDPDWVPRKPR